MLIYRLRRIIEIFTSSIYRRVILSRILCYLLRKLNPQLNLIGITNEGTSTFLFLSDNVVTPYTIAMGNFQKNELDTVIRLCKKFSKHRGSIFLDVGANIGTTTLYALASGEFTKAISFEPAPSNHRMFKLNMYANGYGSEKVKLMEMGVSDKKSEMELFISDDNHGDHRLASMPVSHGGQNIKVPVNTLDQSLQDIGVDPSQVGVVWVDTQGHEGYVLKCANTLIDQKIPFCIEFWPQALTEAGCYEQMLQIIEQKFASFIELGGNQIDQLVPTDQIRTLAKKFEGTIYHTDLLLFPR